MLPWKCGEMSINTGNGTFFKSAPLHIITYFKSAKKEEERRRKKKKRRKKEGNVLFQDALNMVSVTWCWTCGKEPFR